MMGKPCVVAEGNRCAAVQEEKNGCYFDPEASSGMDDFCSVIAGLHGDRERLEAMARDSRRIYENNYTLERQTGDYLASYEQLVDS